MEIARLSQHPYTRPALLYVSWLALFFLLYFRSWVSEDAYITLRVVDNFVQGYGLRWNVTERVQVFTHPLWLLLHLPFAMLWSGNLFHLNMALSLLCSALAVAVMLGTFRKSTGVTLVCLMLPLLLSKCFTDYAGSGLETSLSYLLFALFGYVLVHWQHKAYFMLALSFTSALLLLNRLDHALLVVPVLSYYAWGNAARFFSARSLAQLVLGMLPLIAWLAFAVLYYGFLFPNTKYAKLDTGLPLSDYMAQGLQYSFIWLTQDTLSAVTLLTTLIMAARRGTALQRVIAIAIVLNVGYVVFIGGDYMMGRFFAFIFLVSLWLLFWMMPERMRPDVLFASFTVVFVAFAASYFVRDIRTMCASCIPVKGKVIDARAIFGGNALFIKHWPPEMRTEGRYKFVKEGKELGAQESPAIKTTRFIGMIGFLGGPKAVIIDELALADPLLSRLPALRGRSFYVGHYRRRLPEGYADAVENGSTSRMHPALADYYGKIKIITQGDLWDKERLLTILRFNLGEYEHLKHDYLNRPR